MTSSLVGSEMCIRDRDRVVLRVLGCLGYASEVLAVERRPGCFEVGGSVSVSYTHLTLPTICSV
eukprot:8980665-Prorocentrum_lima.AAC.1